MFSLIIFDIDGTLAEKYTTILLPRVKEFFQLSFQAGCSQRPKIAIATNQGGVGMRHWMETKGFGKSAEYPNEQDIELRIKDLLAALGADPSIPVYISYRYRTRSGKSAPVPPGKAGSPRWSEQWRKPKPGMLLQAMEDAGVSPQDTLYVGDSEDDRRAAQTAGCAFEWANDFFSRDWKECEQLAGLGKTV